MAKLVADAVLDLALSGLAGSATAMTVCSGSPTTFTHAESACKLADVTITSACFTGPVNGDTNGRKITVNAQNGVPVDTTGNAEHVALISTAGSVLLYVTQCTVQALTGGNTVNIPAWDIEIADPT